MALKLGRTGAKVNAEHPTPNIERGMAEGKGQRAEKLSFANKCVPK
jgi:hypothetical protein